MARKALRKRLGAVVLPLFLIGGVDVHAAQDVVLATGVHSPLKQLFDEEASQREDVPNPVGDIPQLSLQALQISRDNIDGLARGGPDAIAGIGDWWLSNGKLCVAVSDVAHDAGIVRGGGSLIDFSDCQQPNDQWTYANILTGLSKETAIPVQTISAHLSFDVAEIIAVGERDGLRQTVTFRLHPDSDELEMDVRIARNGDGQPLRLSGLFTLHSQRSMTPFSLSSYDPEASLGFRQRKIDRHNSTSLIAGLMPADWNILVGGDLYDTGAAYGVQLRSVELIKKRGARQTLPQFLAVFPDYSLHGWMSRPLWLQSDKLNLLSLLQNRFMDLERGEQLLARFSLRLGQRSEVAAITDQIYSGPLLRGYSDHGAVSFSVFDRFDRPISQVRPDDDGSFSLRLPELVQRVNIVASTPWGQRVSRELNINDERNDSGRWLFRQNGRLALPRGVAMSLHFFGLGDTPAPVFGDDLLKFSVDGELARGQQQRNRIDLAGIDSDPVEVELPPGQYRVLSARGIEFRLREYLLTVVAGQTSQLPIVALRRAWYGESWRSADLHVHTGASFDAFLPMQQRLRSFVAQGAEILVASEHNRILDQRSVVDELGLADQVQIVVGSELTGLSRGPRAPYTIGHSNAFPLVAQPTAFAGGIPQIENRPLREVIAAVKTQDPDSVFQLNHPRASSSLDADLAFFEHLSTGRPFIADEPLHSEANKDLMKKDPVSGLRDIDFDLLELMNGAEFEKYPLLRRDWFSLLNQGLRRTGTGNSDSHGLGELVALPRNYIHLPGYDGTLPVPEADLVAALKAGRSFMTTGPRLALTLRDADGQRAGMGETFRGAHGTLDIQVDAAPWVPVDRLTVWVNGAIYRQLPIRAGDHKVLELHLDGDSWVVVEVDGTAGDNYRKLVPGMWPVALSNPVYIDADGNGQWRPRKEVP